MLPEQIEYAGDLIDALSDADGLVTDLPIYFRTPHGTYTFVPVKVEQIEKDGEPVVMVTVREVT